MSWYLLKARNRFSTKAPTDLFIWLNLHACLNVPKRSNFLYMTLFQRYFWFICLCALRRHDDPAYEKRHSFRGGHSVLYSRDSPGYWLHSPTGLHSPGYQTRQPTAWLTGKTHLHAIIYIYIYGFLQAEYYYNGVGAATLRFLFLCFWLNPVESYS